MHLGIRMRDFNGVHSHTYPVSNKLLQDTEETKVGENENEATWCMQNYVNTSKEAKDKNRRKTSKCKKHSGGKITTNDFQTLIFQDHFK